MLTYSHLERGGKIKYLLKLYVTGKTSASESAIKNLKEILKAEIKTKCELEVIDILKRPQIAEDEKIMATPLLEKKLPPPVRRIIGDLSNKNKVLVGLDLVQVNNGVKK